MEYINMRVSKEHYELLKKARDELSKQDSIANYLSLGAFIGYMVDWLKKEGHLILQEKSKDGT